MPPIKTDYRRCSHSTLLPVALAGLCFALAFPRSNALAAEQESAPSHGPRCVLSSEEADFGKVFAFDDNVQTISVLNPGDQPLVVKSMKSSCSCTSAEMPQTEIQPGRNAELTIRLILDNYPQDEVDVYVLLDTNDPNHPSWQIPVTAQIQPEYTVTPATLDFGRVKRGSSPSMALHVVQNSTQDLELTDVETPRELTAIFKMEENNERLAGTPSPKAFEVTVKLNTEAAGEVLNARLFLLTNIPRMARFPVQVQARVVGIECAITPRVAVFGPVPPGSDACTIEVIGVNDLRLLSASCTVTDLDVQVREVQPEKSYGVLVKIKDNATAGGKVGKLRLTLQEGALTETRELAVYGTVSILP